LLCPAHPSFAQSSESAELIGKWELFSVDGRETTIPREKMEVTAEALKILEDCNEQSYTYTIENGKLTATPPAMITMMACGDEAQARNQAAIARAIKHSTVQLSGGALQFTLLPRPGNGELVFFRKLEFRREK
jgi:heat shock protein HslJ